MAQINDTYLTPVHHASVGHVHLRLVGPISGPIPAPDPDPHYDRRAAKAAVRERRREIKRGAPFLERLTLTRQKGG